MKTTNKKSGFTLVELAIVLVIIGLIVGGVLSGQDLIKTATVRSATNQINQFNTAALAFQNKYNGLPGDLLNTVANTALSVTYSGSTAGDGNGLVEGASANTGTKCAANTFCVGGGEPTVFFPELLSSNLIGETITSPNLLLNSATVDPINTLPSSKISGAKVAVISNNGLNYYVLANVGTGAATAGVATSLAGALSPLQASQIDGKIDDGVPGTGSTVAAAPTLSIAVGTADSAGAAKCGITSGSTTAYNIGSTYGNNQTLCALSIRASF